MRILKIIPDTVVDGPGLRTSIYFAGCKHHCEGCHNPESWAFNQGDNYKVSELISEIEKFGNKKITLTGGDPYYQYTELAGLCATLKSLGYNIWMYTGFTFERILKDIEGTFLDCPIDCENGKYYNNEAHMLLDNIDVIVDGAFVNDLKAPFLLYRGSSNQRIIDVKESLKTGKPVLYDS